MEDAIIKRIFPGERSEYNQEAKELWIEENLKSGLSVSTLKSYVTTLKSLIKYERYFGKDIYDFSTENWRDVFNGIVYGNDKLGIKTLSDSYISQIARHADSYINSSKVDNLINVWDMYRYEFKSLVLERDFSINNFIQRDWLIQTLSDEMKILDSDYILPILLAYDGVSTEKQVSIICQDIDRANCSIAITKGKKKNENSAIRVLPINGKTIELIMLHIQNKGLTSKDFLFQAIKSGRGDKTSSRESSMINQRAAEVIKKLNEYMHTQSHTRQPLSIDYLKSCGNIDRLFAISVLKGVNIEELKTQDIFRDFMVFSLDISSKSASSIDSLRSKFMAYYNSLVTNNVLESAIKDLRRNENYYKYFVNSFYEYINPPESDKFDKLRDLFGREGVEGREGLGKIRTHLKQDRNNAFIAKCKKDWRIQNFGRMPCYICEKELEKEYEGLNIGKHGCLEAHHIVLLSASKEERTTRQEDLVILCPNCHSIAHMNINSKNVDEIKLLLKKQL